jgi:thiol-disulfide isomerase/thioredoxin
MPLSFLVALVLGFTVQIPAAPAAPPALVSQAPAPVSTTPAACRKEVADYVAKKRAELPALPTASAGTATGDLAVAVQAVNAQRTPMLRQIEADRLGMSKACAAKFDVQTVSANDLADLSQLYFEAGQRDLSKTTIDRALTMKTMTPAARASTLSVGITTILREETKSPERNARLEKMIDELDKLPDTFIDQKISSHFALQGYYRYDDIDAGIIKHATWLINTIKTCEPAARKTLAPRVVSAYINMAEALAGQGENDKALELLRRAPQELSDVPTAARSVQPEIERLELVGTEGAPITSPRWLNMPPGKTDLDLKGKVTLLEFSAHWCVPCKESYPGVNRLREKYGRNGFQVVIATQMYGYFQTERPLTPEVEFERDRTYFAEHQLNVPIAVNDAPAPSTRNADGSYTYHRNPNEDHYKVGGIPQIHLIDKQGRIRLVMVGYDDANESKLAKMIEAMLKEK